MTLPACDDNTAIHLHNLMEFTNPQVSECLECGFRIEYGSNFFRYKGKNMTDYHQEKPFGQECDRAPDGETTHKCVAEQSNDYIGAIRFMCQYCHKYVIMARHVQRRL